MRSIPKENPVVMANEYDYWREELANPNCNERHNNERPIWGFWRLLGARTKWDTPFAAYGDESGTLFKFGRKDAELSTTERNASFMDIGFMSAVAVTEEEYTKAVLTGEWADGKPSRQRDPNAVANEKPVPGQSNYAPVPEVISERINEILDSIKELGTIDTQQKADKASELGVALKAVFEEGNAAYAKDKEPHNTALLNLAVSWRSLSKAETELKETRNKIRVFLRSEEERQNREAREAAAAAATLPPSDDTSPPEGSSVVSEPAPPTPIKVRAQSAYGRAVTLRIVRRGVIEDENKFLKVVRGDKDFKELLQRKADAFARAQSAKPGMKIVETRE